MDFGKVIRERRKERGLSMEALARMAGVAYNSVWNVEASNIAPTVSVLSKILDALDLELSVVGKRKKRVLSHGELSSLVENIAQDARSGYFETFLTVSDDVDIEVRYNAEVKEHKEDDTGSRVVDECSVHIYHLSALAYVENMDVELPDADALARMVEKKIMEG